MTRLLMSRLLRLVSLVSSPQVSARHVSSQYASALCVFNPYASTRHVSSSCLDSPHPVSLSGLPLARLPTSRLPISKLTPSRPPPPFPQTQTQISFPRALPSLASSPSPTLLSVPLSSGLSPLLAQGINSAINLHKWQNIIENDRSECFPCKRWEILLKPRLLITLDPRRTATAGESMSIAEPQAR